MEMLRTHEYGIPLVRVGHGEGPHVFTFLISALVFLRYDPKHKLGLEEQSFQNE